MQIARHAGWYPAAEASGTNRHDLPSSLGLTGYRKADLLRDSSAQLPNLVVQLEDEV
jgi:hypothetical protein